MFFVSSLCFCAQKSSAILSNLLNSFRFKKEKHKKVQRNEYRLSIKKTLLYLILIYISNYDEFALLVEAGSSLGLWVGLSIIGIVDLIIDLWKLND